MATGCVAHCMTLTHRVDHHRIPAVAATDSQNPMERTNQGSAKARMVMATARDRIPAERSNDTPAALRATIPIAAALITDGSDRQMRTKSTTPSTDMTRSHLRRSPNQDPDHHSSAMVEARFAPETAMRWVSAVALNSSDIWESTAAVSPTTREGTRARCRCGLKRQACTRASRM